MGPGRSPLFSDEQRSFIETVERFARDQLDDPGIAARDASGEFWAEGWRRCATFGMCGLPAPEEFGGGGADRLTTAGALDALGSGCNDGGLVFSLQAHLWTTVVPLWHYGTPEQQAAYLPKLCSGEWIGLHAITEPGAGSDAFALTTVARKDGDDYVLRGRKAFITNAPVADLFVIFARSPETTGPFGITGFIMTKGTPGLVVERPTEKLGLRTSPMSEIALEDVRVPRSAILGREGRGAQIFNTSMMWERTLIMASTLGALERSLQEASAYARERVQFGKPIASFEAVSDRLVDARVTLDAARALLYETAKRYDDGEKDLAPAAAAKLFASETALNASLALLQVLGGYGYTRDFPFERRLRDAVGGRIYSGTSDLMRRNVARSMGL
jgi:hypothetical protein